MNGTLLLRAILIVSLACNIAMVWAFVDRPPPMPPHNAEEFLSRVTQHMPAADSETLRQTFDKYQPALDEKHKQADEAMDAVRTELSHDKVDPAAFSAAIEKAHEARSAYQTVFQDAIEDAAPRLSREARMQLMPMGRHEGPPGPGPGPSGNPPPPD